MLVLDSERIPSHVAVFKRVLHPQERALYCEANTLLASTVDVVVRQRYQQWYGCYQHHKRNDNSDNVTHRLHLLSVIEHVSFRHLVRKPLGGYTG